MNKYLRTAFTNQLSPTFFHGFAGRVYIIDLEGNGVHAFASAFKCLPHRRIGTRWCNNLNKSTIGHVEEGLLYAQRFAFVYSIKCQT